MAIKRQQSLKKVKLPSANLYLDDLEEIINILKPENDDEPPKLSFVVNDMICDGVDDLSTIGGRTSDFRMGVLWQKDYAQDTLEFSPNFRVECWFSGSVQRQSWAMSQVHEIFKRRIDKSRWWVVLGTASLILLVFEVGDHYIHRAFGREGPSHWISVWVLGLLLGYPMYLCFVRFIRSTVILHRRSEDKGSWFQRHGDQIKLHVVTSLISAVVGAAIALLLQKLFGQH
jgi:hypothetical protein